MTWFGSAALALVVALAGDSTVPGALEHRVRQAIAERWDVAPAVVRVEWRRPSGTPLSGAEPFRLAGQGADGRFIALLDTERGEIALGLRAGREVPVWVARRPLGLGATVGDGDLSREDRIVWGPPGEAEDASPAGWEVRRALRAGDRVTPPAVVEPAVIRAGEVVRFEWRLGAMLVTREGIAGAPARRGERVWARDPARGARIEGIATGPGTARLQGGRP